MKFIARDTAYLIVTIVGAAILAFGSVVAVAMLAVKP